MDIQLFGMKERLISLNCPQLNQSLNMTLRSGPFTRLEGKWSFVDLVDGCRVRLDIDCEFKSGIAHMVPKNLLAKGISKTVDAFVSEVRRRQASEST